MSLAKQLSLGVFCIMLSMFVGTILNNTSNSRDFINQQLSSHAQDTATSLALSIMPYLQNDDDLVIAETMSQAIFDRGFYASIEVRNSENEVIILLENIATQENIPAFFIHMFALNAPTKTADITDGWQRSGTIYVTSNTGIAYQQLWTNAVDHFQLSAVIFLISVGGLWLLVNHFFSKPINTLIQQTEQISQQHFVQISQVPSTTELKRFVVAINKMSSTLAKFFSHITQQSEQYRLYAYTDALTQVGNRRAFALYMAQLLRNDKHRASGYLFLINAASLGAIHKSLGGEIADKYLESICEASKNSASGDFSHFAIYRISGSDFALIIENIDTTTAIAFSKKLSFAFRRLDKSEYTNGCANLGATSFTYGEELESILKRADSALAVASSNEQSWQISDTLPKIHSNQQWREKINNLLQSAYIDFAKQAVVNEHKELIYAECFARVKESSGEDCLPMAQLIPATVRLNFAVDLDRMIVEAFIKQLPQATTRLAINLSRMSLFDTAFMAWFFKRLTSLSEHCHKVVIEIPERAVVHDADTITDIVRQLQALGVLIVIEHYGAQLSGIQHIRRVRPDYLKIDGRFTKSIHTEIDNQLFLRSLVSIAHGLNIRVIAEMVETEDEHAWLLSANFDCFQGYQIAAPELIDRIDGQS